MDPYQILGVSSTASDDDVKKAYRQQCKRYHRIFIRTTLPQRKNSNRYRLPMNR